MNKMSKTKKIIVFISVLLVIFLLVATFLSNSIYLMFLPQIELGDVMEMRVDEPMGAIGNFDYTNKEYVYSTFNTKVESINIKKGDKVKANEAIMSLDKDDSSLNYINLLYQKEKCEKNYKNSSYADKNLYKLEYDIAAKNLKIFLRNTNSNGKISVKKSAKVFDIYVKENDEILKGDKLFSTITNKSKLMVSFPVSYTVGMALNDDSIINISYREHKEVAGSMILDYSSTKAKLRTKDYDEATNRWLVTATLDTDIPYETIMLNKSVDVYVEPDSVIYSQVVPTSAIHRLPSGTSYVYYIAENDKQNNGSAFKVYEKEVEILKHNSTYTAIKSDGLFKGFTKIVVSSDKPLSDGKLCNLAD